MYVCVRGRGGYITIFYSLHTVVCVQVKQQFESVNHDDSYYTLMHSNNSGRIEWFKWQSMVGFFSEPDLVLKAMSQISLSLHESVCYKNWTSSLFTLCCSCHGDLFIKTKLTDQWSIKSGRSLTVLTLRLSEWNWKLRTTIVCFS